MKQDYHMKCRRWSNQFITILIALLCITRAFSQIEYPGIPLGFLVDKNRDLPYYIVDSTLLNNDKRYYNEQQTGVGFKVDYFAQTVKVDIDLLSAGRCDHVNAYTNIWRLGITSKKAGSIAVTFDPFFLLPGSKVFIYTPDGITIEGAYTFRNNKSIGLLSISPLPGDSIIVELQKLTNNSALDDLIISTISIGSEDMENEENNKDEWYGRSADCHVDINCIDDAEIQQQKYATCRMIIERTDGRVRCTGTLLNNTSENGLPYVLTAGHCITDMYAAHRSIFYFNYESPYCQGPDGELKSISGSILRSRGATVDFALVELIEKPPVDYYPFYSGWDATGNIFDYSYTIHHPQGDVKKFANDSDMVQEGSFDFFDPGSHWLIPDYDTGTTEAGSSGGPLFDKNNRLVGTLTGGGLECSETIYDYYQKFSYAWDAYSDEESQLKTWLDPENTGTRVWNKLEPYTGLSEIISNIRPDDTLEIQPCDDGWGYISGHNSLHSTLFAEHFYRNGSKYVYALNMEVAKAYQGSVYSTLKIIIWEGEEIPDQIIYEQEVYLFELVEDNEAFIRLDTLILVDRDFFIGYSIEYSEPIDTFALYTLIHNDLDENSALMWRGDDWELLNDGNKQYTASLAIYPMVLNYYPSTEGEFGEYPEDEVTLYPNPTYDILQILLKHKPEGDVHLTLYDLLGNVLYKELFSSPEPNFQLQTNGILKQGLFILKVDYDNYSLVKKFIKLQ